MRFARSALLLILLGAPLAGCGPHSGAPHMVGEEALDELPKDEDYKPSKKAKNLRADGAANDMKSF